MRQLLFCMALAICLGTGMPVSRDAHAATSQASSPRVLSLLHQLGFSGEPAADFSLVKDARLPQGGRGPALVYTAQYTRTRRIAGMQATVQGKRVWMRGLVYQSGIPDLPDLGPIQIDSVLGDDPDRDLGLSDPLGGPNAIYEALEYMLAGWYHIPVSAVPGLITRSGYVLTGSLPTRARMPDGDYIRTAPSSLQPGVPQRIDLRKGIRIVFRMYGQNEGMKISAIPAAARLQIDGGLTAYRAGMYADHGVLTFFKYSRLSYFRLVSTDDYVTVAFDLHNLVEASARQIDETVPPAGGSNWEDDYLTRALSGDTVVPLRLFLQTDAINRSIFSAVAHTG